MKRICLFLCTTFPYRRKLFCIALFCLLSNVTFAQKNNPIELQVINDYPIKIDGGCSFYAHDTTDLKNNKFIFIISAKKIGFISVNNKYVYLRMASQNKITKNNETYLFRGQGYEIELNVSKVKKIDTNDFLYNGKMNIRNVHYNDTLKVDGKIEGL